MYIYILFLDEDYEIWLFITYIVGSTIIKYIYKEGYNTYSK